MNRRDFLRSAGTAAAAAVIPMDAVSEETERMLDAEKGLTLAEVPQGLIEELFETYNSVFLRLNEPAPESVVTRFAVYCDKGELVNKYVVTHPVTFEPIAHLEYEQIPYFVRAKHLPNNGIEVYRIYRSKSPAGSIVEKMEITT